jgi:hypothetical protein
VIRRTPKELNAELKEVFALLDKLELPDKNSLLDGLGDVVYRLAYVVLGLVPPEETPTSLER